MDEKLAAIKAAIDKAWEYFDHDMRIPSSEGIEPTISDFVATLHYVVSENEKGN